MISELNQNLTLKKYFKKPSYIDYKFILKSKKYLLENELNSFFSFLKIHLEKKNIYSNGIFHVYFYLLNLLEKKGKTNVFLEHFVYSNLKHKMYFLYENVIDKDIYLFVKKYDSFFKEINGEEHVFVNIDQDFLKLKEIVLRFDNFNEKNIKKDIKELISFLKKLIKLKKITKKIANKILEMVYYDIFSAFKFFEKKDSLDLNKIILKKDLKI
jgi:hypothetical protein